MDIADTASPAQIADGAVRSAPRKRSGRAPRWRRWRYLVNWRYQLWLSLSVAALVLTLVVLLNVCIFILGTAVIDGMFADGSDISIAMREDLRFSFGLLMTGSVAFVVGIFALTIFRSHRTAGPAFKLSRYLEEVREGHYGAVIRLRKEDDLHELATAFNTMSEALQMRNQEEIEVLRSVAHEAERIGADSAGPALARRIRTLVEKKSPVRSRGTPT